MKRKKPFLFCLIVILCLLSSCSKAVSQPPAEPEQFHENGYKYEIENDAVKIISHQYDPDETAIVVPEQIGGKPVTVLGHDAFYQHKSTVSITLPQSLTTIEGAPFYRCYSLEEIVIPKNVCAIDYNPFFRSSSLKKITVASNNTYFADIDGVLFDQEKTVLISYPEGKLDESYTIPQTVKTLRIDSFGYHTKLKRLTILSNVTAFPEGDTPDSNMFIFPDDITLIVEPGSAAERYAIACELNYELIQ